MLFDADLETWIDDYLAEHPEADIWEAIDALNQMQRVFLSDQGVIENEQTPE